MHFIPAITNMIASSMRYHVGLPLFELLQIIFHLAAKHQVASYLQVNSSFMPLYSMLLKCQLQLSANSIQLRYFNC